MNLIVDVGNTYIKLAVFSKLTLVEKIVVTEVDLIVKLNDIKSKYNDISHAIISSVNIFLESGLKFLKENYRVLVLDHNTKIPFKNLYSTPKTLGIDRIALVAASVNLYKDKNVLVIDAGTCITFDFINDKNEYLGGAISPGIRMRYKALHNQTAKLPLLETEVPQFLIGDSTSNSIHSGVINGIVKEIDGVIQEYSEKYTDLTIILTGGDTNFLSKQLKSSIFANSNFLLEGLNFILYNNINE